MFLKTSTECSWITSFILSSENNVFIAISEEVINQSGKISCSEILVCMQMSVLFLFSPEQLCLFHYPKL